MLGSSHPAELLVSDGPTGFSACRPPPLACRVHPLTSFTSPSEFSGPYLPVGLAAAGSFLGVLAPFATRASGVHTRELPKLATFRPRSFSLPRRLAPPPALRVCFTPLPRPGFALQGFPLRRSRISSSETVALGTFSTTPLPPACACGARKWPAPSGPCSTSESVASRKGLACESPVPLLGFPSSGCSLCSPCPRLHGGSAHDLACKTVESSLHWAYSVSLASSPTDVSRHLPTRSRFPACLAPPRR
jgi:hypothetical protein